MNPADGTLPFKPLHRRERILWAFAAVASFHLAFESRMFAPFILVFFVSILQLSRAGTGRGAVYTGWLVGMCIYGPQLFFFWSIFHQAAIILWLILSSWLAFFLLLERVALRRLGPLWGVLSAPVWWLAVEYFRSELYPLRFSWLNAGYLSPPLSGWFGMYGAGFFLMLGAACVMLAWARRGWQSAVVTGIIVLLGSFLPAVVVREKTTSTHLQVAGVQFEEGDSPSIIKSLDELYAIHPETSLFVLSEYSFGSSIPSEIKEWCAHRRRWLVAGGKQFLDAGNSRYRNTAFVIGPEGTEVFQQAKSRPIQFFDDGLPADRQTVWNSPWGKIGVCICYDLSYTRVTDELIRQGAQALIVPTMDVESWGAREHDLHARVAPTRAAEYGVPIFRFCSSGVSQAVAGNGRILASAPSPGQGQTLAATLDLSAKGGRLPVDRLLVWPCLVCTLALLVWQAYSFLRNARPTNEP